MKLEDVANGVITLKAQQMVDAALIQALLLTHPNRQLLVDIWETLSLQGLAAERLTGNPNAAAAYADRSAYWTEILAMPSPS